MKIAAGTLAVALVLAAPCLFAANSSEVETQCAQWAKEDGVAREELQEYMTECVAEQIAMASDNVSSEEGSPQD